MGRPKNLEKIREANGIKTACKYVYNLISDRRIKKCLKMDVENPDFLVFSIFDYLSPDLRHLQFKNVKLNLKFAILGLILR